MAFQQYKMVVYVIRECTKHLSQLLYHSGIGCSVTTTLTDMHFAVFDRSSI